MLWSALKQPLWRLHFTSCWLKITYDGCHDVVLVSLLLTVHKLHTLFWWFHCRLWTGKYQLGSLVKTVFYSFFSVRVFFHGHWQFTGQNQKGENHLSLCHFRQLTNIQIFMCNFVYEMISIWDLPPMRICIWLLIECCFQFFLWFTAVTYCSNLSQTRGRFELVSIITLVLQGNQLNKCNSHSFFPLMADQLPVFIL